MKVQTGYIYHIKDDFFDKINDKGLMINHENGKARPTYFTIKDKDILWFIPLSSKISKYQPIIDKKIKKRLNDEFIIKLNNKGTIISQKVLQKEEKNSTIEYRVFVVTNEVISNYSYYSVGDDNDS